MLNISNYRNTFFVAIIVLQYKNLEQNVINSRNIAKETKNSTHLKFWVSPYDYMGSPFEYKTIQIYSSDERKGIYRRIYTEETIYRIQRGERIHTYLPACTTANIYIVP